MRNATLKTRKTLNLNAQKKTIKIQYFDFLFKETILVVKTQAT